MKITDRSLKATGQLDNQDLEIHSSNKGEIAMPKIIKIR